MTTYTQAEPFEASNGVKIWPSFHSQDWWMMLSPDGSLEKGMFRFFIDAAHELVEAERHPATWTEQEDGTWRKGRWTVEREDGEYIHVSHADIPAEAWTYDLSHGRWQMETPNAVRDIGDDFLAFYAARTKPGFTPLPVPEVGQWGEFTTRKGKVIRGEVEYVSRADFNAAVVIDGITYFIPLRADDDEVGNDITAWHPIDPPQPSEPRRFGARVIVNGERFLRTPGAAITGRNWVSERGVWTYWASICARGPVTIESPGVEK